MKNVKWIKRLLLVDGLITMITAIWTLMNSGVYDGFVSPDYITESLGQDIVSLAAGMLLCISVFALKANSDKLKVVVAGMLWYLLYAYAIYAFGSVYNILFFCYLAIMSLSLFTGISIVSDMIKRSENTKPIIRYAIPIFLLVTTILLATIWSSEVVSHISAGTKARETVIYVMDLSFVLPAFTISAIKMIKKQSAGVILSGVCLTKAVTIGLSIICGQLIKYFSGFAIDTFLAGFFGIFTLIAAILFVVYLKGKAS